MAYTPNPADPSRPVGSDPPATLPEELRGIKARINQLNDAIDQRVDSLESFKTSTETSLSSINNEIDSLEQAVAGYFQDNTTSATSTTRQWTYTDASGKIWKGGFARILDNGTTITYNQPFPNKCLFVGFTPWATGGSGSTSQIHIEGTPVFRKEGFSGVSDGGDRDAVWFAFGY